MKITENFTYIGTSQNFERDSYKTLAEMKAVVDKRMPDIFTATCKETGKLYIYNKSNEVDETLGKWREVGIDGDDYAKKTDIPTTLPANGGNADTVNSHTVESNVPADAVFTDTTYESVTQTEDGLMSAADKAKLDGVEEGATKTLIDVGLSSTSTNPVQNKVVTDALNNKADKSKYSDTTINVGRRASTTVGDYSTAEGLDTTARGTCSHAEGYSTTAKNYSSHAEGGNTTASGQFSHAEGSNYDSSSKTLPDRTATVSDVSYTISGSTAYGINSHAEGTQSFAYAYSSHAEGLDTTASGDVSHAEGYKTTASKYTSHAEGYSTTANNYSSHAEGFGTTASGSYSHAEGIGTTASGSSSHAEGSATTASNKASHACGHYNAAMTDGGDSNNTTGTAFVIGNGTKSTALSNAK